MDGSGKSSVIKGLQSGVSETVKNVYVLQGTYPTRTTREIKNYAKPPRSAFSSALKIIFRAIKWTLEYYLLYTPQMANGSLILSDRFYFDDVWIDPLKYRYGGPLWLVNHIRNLVPRPDAFIQLDAPETVLYARKQEIPFEDVIRLRKAYLELVAVQKHGFCVDASAPLAEVIEDTRRILLEFIQG